MVGSTPFLNLILEDLNPFLVEGIRFYPPSKNLQRFHTAYMCYSNNDNK